MNIRFLLCTAIFEIFCSLYGLAQTSPTGLIFDDKAYEQSPLMPTDSIRGGELPYTVSLRPYCPTPGDQGNLASCVGWALANALTIERTARNKVNDKAKIDGMRHSVTYIYNQIKLDDCKAGAYLHDGLKLLKEQGDCLASDFDKLDNDCSKKPTDSHRQKALLFTTKGFERLFDLVTEPNRKIDAICAILAKGQPVLIGIRIPDDFKYKTLNALDWQNTKMGHAMVVVGYDMHKNEFDIMNSYGTAWGNGGFFRLSYKGFAENVQYAYRLVMQSEASSTTAIR